MRFLVDENLSPTIATRLTDRGHPAEHVAHRGLSASTDADLWRYAFEADAVVITTNFGDFLELANGVDLHPGLVVFRRGGLTREEQWEWLVPVLEWLKGPNAPDLVNHVVEILDAGKFKVREVPAP